MKTLIIFAIIALGMLFTYSLAATAKNADNRMEDIMRTKREFNQRMR